MLAHTAVSPSRHAAAATPSKVSKGCKMIENHSLLHYNYTSWRQCGQFTNQREHLPKRALGRSRCLKVLGAPPSSGSTVTSLRLLLLVSSFAKQLDQTNIQKIIISDSIVISLNMKKVHISFPSDKLFPCTHKLALTSETARHQKFTE